mmetsp:Transcript_119300/g.210779  ORF Transcript_119300/g.210779 Transcript_119300/m.210779 type:complete len:152 (-) Transcript_119300:100-555(-)
MPKHMDATDINVNELIVCSGLGCMFTSCYTTMPDCIGCKQEAIFLCMQSEGTGFKFLNKNENADGKCLLLAEGSSSCVMPSTCCLIQSQMCCLDTRGALPCNEKVPCICTLCPFLVLFANGSCVGKCGKTVGEVTSPGGTKVSPSQEEMKN